MQYRPHISKSDLDLVHKSPHTYYMNRLDPNRPRPVTSAAFEFGKALHSYILEQEKFDDSYAIAPNVRRGTKAWLEFERSAGEKSIIKADELEQIKRMQKSVASHPVASRLLKGKGSAEQTIFWQDEATGEKCKAIVDYFNDDLEIIVDVKTSAYLEPHSFQRKSYDYRYHVQAAMYLDGAEKALGRKYKDFYFLTISKSYPYEVCVYQACKSLVAHGRKEYEEDLTTYMECKYYNEWPKAFEGIVPLEIPRWLRASD